MKVYKKVFSCIALIILVGFFGEKLVWDLAGFIAKHDKSADVYIASEFIDDGFVDPLTFDGSDEQRSKVLAYIGKTFHLAADRDAEIAYFNKLVSEVELDAAAEPERSVHKIAMKISIDKSCRKKHISSDCDYKTIAYTYHGYALSMAASSIGENNGAGRTLNNHKINN